MGQLLRSNSRSNKKIASPRRGVLPQSNKGHVAETDYCFEQEKYSVHPGILVKVGKKLNFPIGVQPATFCQNIPVEGVQQSRFELSRIDLIHPHPHREEKSHASALLRRRIEDSRTAPRHTGMLPQVGTWCRPLRTPRLKSRKLDRR